MSVEGIPMCTAVKMYNYIKVIAGTEPEDNEFRKASEEFENEILETRITGINPEESQGVFYLFRDSSAISLFPSGVAISSPDMVLNALVKESIKAYEKSHGGLDRCKHDG